ncbi:MAG: hypothetical protein ACOCSJ_01710 [Candidatus Natronoplasma sp.]
MTEAERLVVEKSPVEAGGRARVNSAILDELEITRGDLTVVSSDKKDILVTVFGDDLVDEGRIRLRVNDMDKLGVEEDEEVSVKKHKKFLTKLL